jgi:hypothetical protein
MKNKLSLFIILIVATLVLAGCAGKPAADKEKPAEVEKKSEKAGNPSNATLPNVCKEEKVTLPNYGDPGKRLKSCFVQYPGEPSRQDKSYYVVEDICGQFTKEFVENMLGERKITKLEPPQISSLNNCSYYFDEKEYVMLNLEYLSIENQKTGNEFAGYRTEKSGRIPMENLVVYQKDDLINVIYLVFNPNKYLSLRPSSAKAFATPEEFLKFAANLGGEIKNYK